MVVPAAERSAKGVEDKRTGDSNALFLPKALGKKLRLDYNSQDLRTVRAFGDAGAEIGVLKAQGAWSEIVHDLKLRQEVIRLRGRKHLEGAMHHEGLTHFIENKLAQWQRCGGDVLR